MHRLSRHTCRACNQHPAGYFDRRGRFKAAPDHPLCVRCFRTELDRERARQLFERPAERRDRAA
jgi:hypothetical protein